MPPATEPDTLTRGPARRNWRPSWLGFVGAGLVLALLAVVMVQARQFSLLRQAFDSGSDFGVLTVFQAEAPAAAPRSNVTPFAEFQAHNDRALVVSAVSKPRSAASDDFAPASNADPAEAGCSCGDPRQILADQHQGSRRADLRTLPADGPDDG